MSTTTSSSSGRGRAAARSPATSPPRASASCCSNAATGCPASRRTGRPRTSSSTAGTSRRHLVRREGQAFFQPQVHYFVGGATKLYGAALYRMREQDFGELHHHDGLSPAWPISYQDMEPYYTAAENLYQVHGARGEDPTEPPSTRALPVPRGLPRAADPAAVRRPGQGRIPPVPRAVRHPGQRGEPAVQHLREMRRLRRLPVPAARQVRRRGARRPARPSSTTTSRCCGTRRRSSWKPTRPAPRSPRSWSSGTARRSATRRDIVVVACGAANSAKLLLASASDKHPKGLANGSDQVGRNFMYHDSQAVLALSKEPNPTVFQKTLGVNDFYFSGPDFDYPMGNIQMIGKSQAAMFRGEKPLETKFAPSWALRDVAAARRGLLAVHRGPAAARKPGHARLGRQRPHPRTRRATPPRPSGCTPSSSRCSAHSACTRITWRTGSRT